MCGLILAYCPPIGSVSKALDEMQYRGIPGRRGVSIRGGWVLGHVRLPIQDLSDASAQPVSEESYSFAYVGEIFNRPGQPDLVAARESFAAYGVKGFTAFDGFWAAAAAYDDGSAVVFTDYLGQKPLYVWEGRDVICSELEPMFEVYPRPPLDEIYLSNVIKFGYDYSGRTPYQGIYQVAPGTVLKFFPRNWRGAKSSVYWDWTPWMDQPLLPSNLRALLTDSIRRRLLSDLPVCLLFSGGLDSSIIYYTLKHVLGKDVQTFTVENGESEFLPPGVSVLPPPRPEPLVALHSMQAPLDLGSMVPQYQLGLAVKDAGYNVAISGDGADELFGGYRRAQEYDSQASDVFCELPYYHFPRLDRQMMRHTVELRSPFLAPEVVGFALALPWAMRTSKQMLKMAFRKIVPSEILDRPKHPLKTAAVMTGGLSYRKELVNRFRYLTNAERNAHD